MKVIILAADSDKLEHLMKVPRCLTQIAGSVTLLERQLRVLMLCGISRNDIVVVVGSQGVWSNNADVEAVRSYGCSICINNHNINSHSGYSLLLALEHLKPDEKCLVISGDVNFEVKHVEVLLAEAKECVALVRQALAVSERGVFINTKSNQIVSVGTSIDSVVFPWYIFCGMITLTPTLVEAYKKNIHNINTLSYFEALFKNKCKETIYFIDFNSPISGEQSFETVTRDLTGGSYANLKKRHLVRKQANGEGRQKLLDEINWLLSLPTELKRFFPTVEDYQCEGDSVWFDMPWYDLNNLRKNILTGAYNPASVAEFNGKVLDFMFSKIYPNIIGSSPDNWVEEKHINRVILRIQQCYNRAPVFRSIILADKIEINGIVYKNIPQLIYSIKSCEKLKQFFKPDYLRMIHGDLHFQNMLVTNNKQRFILADPRGELLGSDVYYDLGKLWHSFNGMYDLIHTDQIMMTYSKKNECNNIVVNLELGTEKLRQGYHEIHNLISNQIIKYDFVAKDKYWLLKIKFAEAMHFSSVMPFHLKNDGTETRSIALYFAAVMLINELVGELEYHSLDLNFSIDKCEDLIDIQSVLFGDQCS